MFIYMYIYWVWPRMIIPNWPNVFLLRFVNTKEDSGCDLTQVSSNESCGCGWRDVSEIFAVLIILVEGQYVLDLLFCIN